MMPRLQPVCNVTVGTLLFRITTQDGDAQLRPPHTINSLRYAGLRRGKRVIETACGSGSVTIGLPVTGPSAMYRPIFTGHD
jgi:hypothetical protein